MATAAAIIIGNEILSGKFADENGPFLIERLRAIGVDLERIVVIPDVVERIAAEVRLAAGSFDYVFTSGGVGPTHDDLTLEAVARGLDTELEQREELVELIRSFGMEITAASLRMACVPKGTELLQAGPSRFPVIRCGNVFVLPGVPKLFRRKFEELAPLLVGIPIRTARLFTDEYETAIATRLNEADAQFPSVSIGSYPRFDEGAHHVMVTLESRDEGALDQAVALLADQLSLIAPVEH
ncbi:MAG: competence/damage-inducible protein A [Proteobacteria bacterium]|nr:competence/damage-inducible protein A [Pseudomonadota bacterium]